MLSLKILTYRRWLTSTPYPIHTHPHFGFLFSIFDTKSSQLYFRCIKCKYALYVCFGLYTYIYEKFLFFFLPLLQCSIKIINARKIQREDKEKKILCFEVRRSFNCLYFVRRVKKNEKVKEGNYTYVCMYKATK